MSKISTMERARVQSVDMRSLSKLAMKLQSEDTQQHITVALKVSNIKTDKDLYFGVSCFGVIQFYGKSPYQKHLS